MRLAINQRHKLEHLCRYITRPAIANDRLAFNRAGQVVLTLKTPYRDGTTHIAMEPLEFMQPPSALASHPLLYGHLPIGKDDARAGTDRLQFYIRPVVQAEACWP